VITRSACLTFRRFGGPLTQLEINFLFSSRFITLGGVAIIVVVFERPRDRESKGLSR